MNELERPRLHHRVGLAVVAVLVLLFLALLPQAIGSTWRALVEPPTGQVYTVAPLSERPTTGYVDVHVELSALDELQRLLTLRVSAHRVCQPACTGSVRIDFFSLQLVELRAERLPPSASVMVPPNADDVTQTIQLPLSGQPIHYPFDRYELWLGVVLDRVDASGAVQALPADQARGQLALTIREGLSDFEMAAPVAVDPQTIRGEAYPRPYVYVERLTLGRSRFVQVLSVLLVLLIAAAAVYAVFMRPLHDLVISSGGLLLGVWGVRAILVPGDQTYWTLLDLALAEVIVFLLGALSVRALVYLWERNALHLPRRFRHK